MNEMFTWMESHPLPFACSINLVDQLDLATPRSFSLKIGFLQELTICSKIKNYPAPTVCREKNLKSF
jgi:hypothetical protein